MSERLVVLAAGDAAAALADVRTRHRVSSLLPPRLAVADLDDEEAEALLRLPTTEGVISGPREPIPASLTEGERLFVQAWQQQQEGPKQGRPGEGLTWDAEGFLPPDPPRQQ